MFTQMAWRAAAASRRRKLRSLAVAHPSRAARRLFGAKSGIASAMLVSGCTWFSPDAGMGVVATIAQQELKKDVAAIRSPEEAEAAAVTVRRLLNRTLTADAAVQIALLNNRGLQAAYDELAIADAERPHQEILPDDDGHLKKLFKMLQAATSVDFTHYKKTTIRRRIGRLR